MRVDKIHPDFPKTEGSQQHYKRVEPQKDQRNTRRLRRLWTEKTGRKSSGEIGSRLYPNVCDSSMRLCGFSIKGCVLTSTKKPIA